MLDWQMSAQRLTASTECGQPRRQIGWWRSRGAQRLTASTECGLGNQFIKCLAEFVLNA